MKAAVGALIVVLISLSAARPATALTVNRPPLTSAVVGQPVTLRLAGVAGAVGNVTTKWDFGDGTPTTTSADMQATHVFAAIGLSTVIVNASDDSGATAGTSFTQLVHAPLTPTPPANSSSIILDVQRHQIWAVNSDADTVSIVDTQQLKKVREVAVGDEPHALAQAPDGTIWITNQGSDEIFVLDPTAGETKARIALPYASQPRGIAFGRGGKAFVALFATGKLIEIDAATRNIGRELALGPTPYGVSVAADGRIFVTRFISPQDHGEVWVVSPDTFALKKTIPLAFDPGPDTQSSGRGVPNYVSTAVISPEGTQAWVTVKKDDVARGIQRDGLPMDPDNFVRPAVCVIDLVKEAEDLTKRRDLDNRATPVSVAFSPFGDYGFVLVQGNNMIRVLDGFEVDDKLGIRSIGKGPDGLVLAPDGKLYVNAFLSRELYVYDVNTILASDAFDAPAPLAKIATVDHEPLSAQVLLGKQIFYDAADVRMSSVGYWSCASCHFGGFSDGRVWDFTDRGEGLRNTKSLLGIRGAVGEGRVHWSANFDEIQDFERDIRESFGGKGFMPDAEYKARLGPDGVYDGLGKPAAGVSPELDALAAYITSLDKVPRSPFRNPDGSFTAAALAGREIFNRAGCPVCHSGKEFTDSASGMLWDVGTIVKTSGFRLGKPLQGLDTPTLKGLWQSAPYLHDGRAATLTEIFTKYLTKDQMGKTSDLTPTELSNLIEYLQELDDVPETKQQDFRPPPVVGTCAVGGDAGSVGHLAGFILLVVLAIRRQPRRRGAPTG